MSYARQLSGQLEPQVFDFEEVIPTETVLPVTHESTAPTTEKFASDPAIRDYPAAFVLKMRGGRIAAHGVLSPDNRVIGDLSVEGGVRAEKVNEHSLLHSPSIAPYQKLAGRSACIVNAYAGNYYHWILEVIPRYELLKRHVPTELANCERIVFNQTTHSYHREVINYLGLNGKVFESHDKSFIIEDMLVPSLAGIMINPPPWACRYVREALIGMGDQAAEFVAPPLIYVSRANADRRRILNESEILEVLSPLGFEVVRPEEWTVAQQVRAFRQARAVVSPHGAALSNTVFCSPGTKILELFSPKDTPPCYWLVASHGQLEYRSILCDAAFEIDKTAKAEDEDIVVNIDKLKSTLHSLDLI